MDDRSKELWVLLNLLWVLLTSAWWCSLLYTRKAWRQTIDQKRGRIETLEHRDHLTGKHSRCAVQAKWLCRMQNNCFHFCWVPRCSLIRMHIFVSVTCTTLQMWNQQHARSQILLFSMPLFIRLRSVMTLYVSSCLYVLRLCFIDTLVKASLGFHSDLTTRIGIQQSLTRT